MKKKKKSNLSPKKGIAKNKKVTIILVILFILSLGIIGLGLSKRDETKYKEDTKYFIGSLYSANHAANLLDYAYSNKNIIISPYNINTSLAILYNSTDNNSNKEIKSYFQKDQVALNEELKTKILSNEITQPKETKYTKLYEKYINEINSKSYNNQTIDTLKLLSNSEKENILLSLKKANLTLDRINNQNEFSEKEIKNYQLKTEDKTYNEYYIKKTLDDTLDEYETYKIKNEVTNYTEIYTPKIKINEEFEESITDYNIKMTELSDNALESTKIINDNIKEITKSNVTRAVDESEINENEIIIINSLHFNYAWEETIKNDKVSDAEFFKFNDEVEAVEMMYTITDYYYENEYAKAFVKDFEDSKYSYIAILPNTIEDFTLSSLNINDLLLSKKEAKTLVGIPKISYQSETDIKKLVSNYKITEVFTEDSNLTRLTDEKIKISQMKQKIRINIGEKGTTNTTISQYNLEAYPEEEYEESIILNRPYAHLIINNETNDVMLIGKVVSPNESS